MHFCEILDLKNSHCCFFLSSINIIFKFAIEQLAFPIFLLKGF